MSTTNRTMPKAASSRTRPAARALYGLPYESVRADLGKKKPSDVYRATYAACGPYAHRIAQFAYLAGEPPFPAPERVAELADAVSARIVAALGAVRPGKAPFDARLGEALLEMGDEDGARILAHAAHAIINKSGVKKMVEDPAEVPPSEGLDPMAESDATASTSTRFKKLESCPRFRTLMERWSASDARAVYSQLDARTHHMHPDEYGNFYSRVIGSERRKGSIRDELRKWLNIGNIADNECDFIDLVVRQSVIGTLRTPNVSASST